MARKKFQAVFYVKGLKSDHKSPIKKVRDC